MKMISECKVKAAVLKSKHREERRSTRKRDPLLGQRVLLPGDRWNIGGYHPGVITRRGKFRPRGGVKQITGYFVKYAGDDDNQWSEWWRIEDLDQYFVNGDVTS